MALPIIILALAGAGGLGGLALSAKGTADFVKASAKNRLTLEQNERNLFLFDAHSEKLAASLEDLGKQRMVITRNFSVFTNAFEKIRNKPTFSKEDDDVDLPQYDFKEIKDSAVLADAFLGATVGAAGGSVLAAVASSGTTAVVMALGTASTGTPIASLSGAAATKAALAALGGGSLASGGGGIALGTFVLNAASLGVTIFVEGIVLAIMGPFAKKKAEEAYTEMLKNEAMINNIIKMQLSVADSVDEMKKTSVDICNNIYKPIAFRLKELVAREQDWNRYTSGEKILVDNAVKAVRILHYLNNTPLYKATKTNENGEVEEVEANTEEVRNAINKAQKDMKGLR